MRNFILTCFMLLLCIISVSAQENIPKKSIPSIEIKDINGNAFNTLNIQNNGKPIIIDFWATWCKPCVKELMTLDENYQQWQDETGVKIFIVSIDDSRSVNRVLPLVNGNGWTFEVLLDQNEDFKRAMGVIDVPYTFILDGSGNIVYVHTSFAEGDEQEYYEKIKELSQIK